MLGSDCCESHSGPRRHRRPRLLATAAILAVGLSVVVAAATASADPSATPTPAPTTRSAPPTPVSPSPSGSGTASPDPTGSPPPGSTALPSWPAAPTGGAGLPTGQAPEDGGGNPWGWNIAGTVADAITAFVARVVAQTSGPALDLLGRTVLATPDLTHQDQVRALWTACLVAADTSFVLFIVIAGVQLVARETVQTRYGFKQLIPRLLVGMIAANCALPVIAQAITLANAVTAAVTHEALDTTTTHDAVH